MSIPLIIKFYNEKGTYTMENFQVISDGACDLLASYKEKHNLIVVPFYVSFDKEHYFKEGIEFDHDEFYRKMEEEHAVPSSTLPSIGDFYDAFLPVVKQNIPIICICITSKFSGSYNSACNAKAQILEEFPNAKITVIDSTLNTVTLGLYVNEAIRMRDDGISYEKAIEILEKIKSTGRIYFTVATLEYLIKNGRIGKVAVIAGDKLGIKPIIIMKEGEISLGGITRSRVKTKKKIIEQVKKHFEDNHLSISDFSITVGTGFDYEEVKAFGKELETALNTKLADVETLIGTTIGCHVGPHPIGIGFVQKYDADLK